MRINGTCAKGNLSLRCLVLIYQFTTISEKKANAAENVLISSGKMVLMQTAMSEIKNPAMIKVILCAFSLIQDRKGHTLLRNKQTNCSFLKPKKKWLS